MKTIATLNSDQRQFIFNETAFKMNVHPVVIEKDYWVCLVLDFLFNHSSFKNNFIFKGGTSLSKCFGVIERFSEDIDLILKWSVLGIDSTQVFSQRNKTQNAKFADNLNKKCIEYLEKDFVCLFKRELCKYIGYEMDVKIDEIDKQTINIYYPSLNNDDYIKPFIRLEIGPVSLQTPEMICSIEPYCAKYYSKFFKQSNFNVPAISIERTFFEKLLILSNENDRPVNNKRPSRYSRHYYDIYKIFNSNYFDSILSKTYLFEEIKDFKNMFFRTSWSHYDSVALKNINIVPNAQLMEYLKKDYTLMKNMFFNDEPSFEDIVTSLIFLENILKK